MLIGWMGDLKIGFPRRTPLPSLSRPDRDQSPSACRTICGYNVPALLSFRRAMHFVLTLTNTELVSNHLQVQN